MSIRTLLLVLSNFLFLLFPTDAFSFVRRRSSTCNNPILTFPGKGGKKTTLNGHSHVEGASYQDDFDEIEAMGGDPFFLADYKPDMTIPENMDNGEGGEDEDDTEGDKSSKRLWKATDGNGPKPLNVVDVPVDEWDGVEIEGAYFDD